MNQLPEFPLTKENYFEFNEHEGLPVIHSSALKYLFPGQGGSVRKMKMYYEELVTEKQKPHQSLGKLFHKYLENKKEFVVSPDILPGEGVISVVQHVFDNLPAASVEGFDRNTPDMWPLIGTQIIASARAVGFQSRWGDDAILKNVMKDGDAYWKFLCEAQGHHMLTSAQKEAFEGMSTEVNNSPYAEVIFDKTAMHEVPILWKTSSGIWCKALIDWLLIEDNMVRFIDFKTTSKPVGVFFGEGKIVWDLQESKFKETFSGGDYYDYRYYRQFAFYKQGLSQVFFDGKSERGIESNVFSIESVAPYECMLPDTPTLSWGDYEIGFCFNTALEYQKTIKKF